MPRRAVRKNRHRRVRRGVKLNRRQKTQVKRLIGVRQEKKYYLAQTSISSISTTPTIFQQTTIPQGDTDQSRDGDRLYLQKFYVRGSIYVGDNYNQLRVIFFQWKPTSIPTAANILANGPSGSIDIHSQYVHDTRQMYKILYDKNYKLEGNGSAATAPVTTGLQKSMNFILYPKLKQLQYQGGSTNGTNQVYWLSVSDSSAISHPTITMCVKFIFTDG